MAPSPPDIEISVLTGENADILDAIENIEIGFFALGKHYVCDGLIASVATLGAGYMGSFKEEYQTLRLTGHFHQVRPGGLNKALAKPAAAP